MRILLLAGSVSILVAPLSFLPPILANHILPAPGLTIGPLNLPIFPLPTTAGVLALAVEAAELAVVLAVEDDEDELALDDEDAETLLSAAALLVPLLAVSSDEVDIWYWAIVTFFCLPQAPPINGSLKS